jgi:hypothetical protein
MELLDVRPYVVGEGIISGFDASSNAVPVAPTAKERKNPGFERSIKYQSTGLTRKSVSDAWSDESHGSLR